MKLPKFRLRGFSRPSEAFIASLGKLERDALIEAWRHKEVSVRQVWKALGERFAYTTVMTTLDRLFKKDLLERRKVGRAFVYSSRFSPEEINRAFTEDVIVSLFDPDAEAQPILACFVDAVSDRDRLLLDELERLVLEKRQRLQNGE